MRYFFLYTIIFLGSIRLANAQDGLYNPAYSNPYTSPMSTPGNNNGNGNGPGSNNGNGNGNGNDGNQGNGWGNGGQNGVPLDTEAWALMIAGAAFGIWKVLGTRKPA